ncbi:MAG: DNA alkylation repair protein [Bacteroidota bacterium]
MNFKDLFQALKEAGTEQNRKVYRKHGADGELFGVSFAVLRDLKKKTNPSGKKRGQNQSIADQLWKTGDIDARILATMVAEPHTFSEEKAKAWAEEINYSVLADSLAEMLTKADLAQQLIEEWTLSEKEYLQRIGFSMLNFIAKNEKGLPDDFFTPFIEYAEHHLQQSPNRAKEGMNNCLIMIGGRNEVLRDRVLQAAEIIGPVEIDHGETNCQTFVIPEYLERIWKRKKE